MAKRQILAGSADQTVDVFIQDSSSTTGAGLTGLAYNTASLTCYYRKGATGTPTALSLATQTVGGAHSDGGFVAVDGTNCPGQYRLDLSDTIVATAGMVTVHLKGAANMVPCVLEIEVVDFSHTGQSAIDLKDFADAGYDPSTNKVQGVVLVDTLTTYTSNTPQTGDAYAIVNSGTHGNSALKTLIDTVDTVVDAILVDTAEIGVAGAGLTNINLPNQTMDIVGNITGNLSGSVGSVTGAVGSVTGAVGSVTGAVGSVTGNVGGNVTGSVGSVAAGGITAASIATGAIDADALAADAGTELADAILSRNVSNVEGSAGEHTLCTVVLAMLENSISGTTLTIKRTDGSTTHYTKTLTADAAADPIVGIQ